MSDDKVKWDKLTEKAHEFVKHVSSGHLDDAMLQVNDQMKHSLPGDALKQVWQSLEAQAGAYQGSAPQARTIVEQGFDSVYLAAKFEKAGVWLKIVFEGDKVAGFQVVPK
jgi:hypothetical protein